MKTTLVSRYFIALLLATITFSSTHASESLGTYNKGSLKDAVDMSYVSARIHKIFVKRKRSFTSRSMFETLEKLAFELELDFPDVEPLQLGDLSNEHGGHAWGHKSHQNGLDADLVYLKHNHMIQSPLAKTWKESFVYKGKVTQNFHFERNWELFTKLIRSGKVARIFVDRIIKKHYCENIKTLEEAYERDEINEVLRRLRPSKGHHNHLHVRLYCPADNTRCYNQSEPAKGTACSAAKYAPKKKVRRIPDHGRRSRRDR